VAAIAARGAARFVRSEDLIARIMAQACRQSGLSIVYSELLDFEGSEIYFTGALREHCPDLVGGTFRDALLGYGHCAPIGIIAAGGTAPLINPPHDRRLGPDDRIILIAEDDSTVAYTGAASVDDRVVRALRHQAPPLQPERYLFVQWNRKGGRILTELDRYVAAGTTALVAVSGVQQADAVRSGAAGLKNIAVRVEAADLTRPEALEALQPKTFNHIILLSPEQIRGVQQADAHTLALLLLVREIIREDVSAVTIVSEMQDVRNRALAEAAHPDDFIVSSRIDSLHMAQLSENPHLADVFEDLFDADGSELYLKPVEQYFPEPVTLSFGTLVRACSECGQIAIGYRIEAERYDEELRHNPDRQYGVVINPDKNHILTLRPGDQIIVISES
jgi:ABC-type transporter Mla MlaB component